MAIKITDCHFENNGTGIKAPTSVEIDMSGTSFKGNGKVMFRLLTCVTWGFQKIRHKIIYKRSLKYCKAKKASLKTYKLSLSLIVHYLSGLDMQLQFHLLHQALLLLFRGCSANKPQQWLPLVAGTANTLRLFVCPCAGRYT